MLFRCVLNEEKNNMEIDAGHRDILVMSPCCDSFFFASILNSTALTAI